MRVFIAGFQHETNSFAPSAAGWSAFEQGDFFPAYARAEAMLAVHASGAMPISGFIAAARRQRCQIVPSCWAGASPSGPVTSAAFERIADVVLTDLAKALAGGSLDGIYLDLHGAAVSREFDSLETELLRRIRAVAGSQIPIVISLDLHANVPPALLAAADAAVAYQTYPHVDLVETGQRAFTLLRRRIAAGRKEPCASRRIPFLIPVIAQLTSAEPAASVRALLGAAESRHGVIASFAAGFPAVDVAHCGPCIWAHGQGSDRAVGEIFDHVMAQRTAWRRDTLDAMQAVQLGMTLAAQTHRPVVIADPQDNPGAGTDSNTTGLLHALLAAGAGRRWPGQIAIGFLNDPQAADAAWQAGVGACLEISVGASVRTYAGHWSEPPVRGSFRVQALHPGAVTLRGPMMTGTTVQTGRSACLMIEGVMVAVSSAKTQMLDRELYRSLGICPEVLKLIVNKSAVHFRADFEPMASHVLIARSAGPMAVDPGDLDWRKLSSFTDTRP